MHQKPIQIGILGTAAIAGRYLVPALLEMKDSFLVAGVASRNKEKAETFAGKFGIKPVTGYETLLNDPELDAVYIPLPNALHYEWIEKALKQNLHVLVEKSLACELSQVEKLNDLAGEKNLVLLENFQFRFHNQLQFILDEIKNGRIGELRSIRANFGFPPFQDSDNIRYSKNLGGGALLDTGAYPLKIARILMGEDIRVESAVLNYNGQDVDIWGGGMVSQKNGPLFMHFSFGFDHVYQCTLELWGSRGRLSTNRIFTAPPGFQPVIELETQSGRENLTLPADHHFKNMLSYFHQLITDDDPAARKSEYFQNNKQAHLIDEFKRKCGNYGK